MPRKTKHELEAERSTPSEGTEAYWRVKRTEASAKRQMLEAQRTKLNIDRLQGSLIPIESIQEQFSLIARHLRNAQKQLDKEFGVEAGNIVRDAIMAAEREEALIEAKV